MLTLRLVVTGRVQGVGFRWFVVRLAREARLSGGVWNRADGAVELEAHGPQHALAAFAADVRRGPSGARVEHVVEDWLEDHAPATGFEIRG